MARRRLDQLYYITHIRNVRSIIALGILSHERVERDGIDYEPIYDRAIVESRGAKQVPDGRPLWGFANLYFQPRNPMLYRVLHEKDPESIVVLGVRHDILERDDVFFATGNAASPLTELLPAAEGRGRRQEILKGISKDWWNEEDGSKREIMAECLVPDCVPARLVQTAYVASQSAAAELRTLLSGGPGVPIVYEPHMFFQPAWRSDLTERLSLVKGDMFFSGLQTLTVSVNCVGVMGKGLASRAKYQFPDVYVRYQDLCRQRVLRLGRPYLYKREVSFDHELADEPQTLSNANSDTWFLLFPTKGHWKEPADLKGIEDGLQWVQDSYLKEGVSQLAVPALGCGLGKLDWRQVGPLICSRLGTLDIPVQVYLPAERAIPDDLLTRNFLLRGA
jgi:hypothetical protein